MDPIITFDMSMLIGVLAITAGMWLTYGLGPALISLGVVVIVVTIISVILSMLTSGGR